MPARGARKADGLNNLEARFVREYLIDLSQTNALRRADGGTKEKSWRELAYQMMARPHVKDAVQREMAKQFQRLETTSDDVKREIIRMALFDPAHVTGVSCPEDIALLPNDVRRAIVGWSWDKNGNFTVKLAKEGALDMLAKHFGLYKADNEQKGTLHLKKSAADMTDDELMAIAQQRKAAPERSKRAAKP